MATYNLNINTVNSSLTYFQAEKFIYGSSRLGILKDSVNVLGSAFGNTDSTNVTHSLGNKRYEFSNHLGNVLTVITDKPIPHNNGGTVDYWQADILSAQDYSPFGVQLDGRTFDSEKYRYGFNSMEKDDQVKGRGNSYDFGARMYDSRLGRWLTIDPLFAKYPCFSSYSFVANSPIILVDSDGKEWVNSYDAKVKELEGKVDKNPNNKKFAREYKRVLEKQLIVNEIIKDIRDNDISLYNYIDVLTVENHKTGEITNVKVKVEIGDIGLQLDGENAHTSYSNKTDKGKGSRIPVKYKGLESDESLIYGAPINDDNEIGFNITLFYVGAGADVDMANEIGDVMYRMEYPRASMTSGSDFKKNPLTGEISIDKENYYKEGNAGDYSRKVENIYKDRKKTGEGKNENNNPYPLKK